MTEDQARKLLEPFVLQNATLDSAISFELWKAGYVEAQDVTDHDTPPGQKEYLATKLTAAGRRLMRYLKQ